MNSKYVYIETYGCQMNLADTEIVKSILLNNGYNFTEDIELSDIILMNTCSVRENAEQRIFGRLGNFKKYKTSKKSIKVVGILGCMAERLQNQLIEENKIVDFVVGPDEYRKLPLFIDQAIHGKKGIGIELSTNETYDDIPPYREEGLAAWIPIMRGCNNFCTYCVVPYTRGRERSRDFNHILDEVKKLSERGFREITFLGQNVNSYNHSDKDFADLLSESALIDRKIRLRFATSHPKDLSDKLLYTIAKNENICNYIHLPVQSGSTKILKAMNRTYTIEDYLNLIDRAKNIIPGVSFTTDIIAGFPGETEEDHQQTLDVFNKVKYDGAYMFKYSPREGTKAYNLVDDVPEELKLRRLNEIIDLQHNISAEINNSLINNTVQVLVEGFSKKSDDFLSGRSDTNKVVIFPLENGIKVGDYVNVMIEKSTSATLFGKIVS